MERTRLKVYVRWMIRRDIPSLHPADFMSFDDGAVNVAWNDADLIKCLSQRNAVGMVAEIGEQVVGFMVYTLHKEFLGLQHLSVNANYRRRGIGRVLMAKLLSKVSSSRRSHVIGNVADDDLTAQSFLKATGWVCTAVEGDQYRFEYEAAEKAEVVESVESAAFGETGEPAVSEDEGWEEMCDDVDEMMDME